MKKVILDTNFLMIPGLLRVDIFSEIDRIMHVPFEIVILKETIGELEKIINVQRGKDKDASKLALALIKQKRIKIIEAQKQKSLNMKPNSKRNIVDDIILEESGVDTIVATQDKGLKKRLLEKKIGTIILRNKKYLELKDVL